MKRTLSLALLISLLVACNNQKKEEEKSSTTDTTKVAGPPNTQPPNVTMEPADPSGMKADVQFADPEVQRVADAYTAFIETYKGGTMVDRKQTSVYLKEVQEWNGRIMNVATKLANNPAEAQKWTEWAKRLAARYQVKANK